MSLWDDLQHRWPEDVLEPTLTRIASVLDLLGSPQQNYPIVHVTGTNGKTSTARMIASLLQAAGLRTGLFTSPHLMSPNERICIDGEPISDDRVLATWADIQPYVEVVDAQSIASGGPALSFFEVMTAMAYAAFADAPVDVAVIEVGMGGTWDATNAADGNVAVITPIDLDHQRYLGDTERDIAWEKAGIIKSHARVIIAQQIPDVVDVLRERCIEMDAVSQWEGLDFLLTSRVEAVGGQVITVQVGDDVYADIFLPLFGAHQAQNAATALCAVAAIVGRLTADVVEGGFAEVSSPGRLQVMRRNPTIVVDAAHNPHGMTHALKAVHETFDPGQLVVIFGALADKDVRGMLRIIADHAQSVVLCAPRSPRALPLEALQEIAIDELGRDRVFSADNLADAVDRAVTLAEGDSAYGGGTVLVTGSLVLVGDLMTSMGSRT